MSVQSYRDTTLGIEDRVAHLLDEMTVEEKVAQLQGVWTSELLDMDTKVFNLEKTQQRIPHGTGHITRLGAVSMLPPTQTAALANQIQRFLVERTRLAIPGIVHEESCAGYLAKDAMTYPQAIGLAATWEPELIEDMAKAMRYEMRAVGAHHTLAPVLDVARDPRWGRVEETFGEDPFLISAMGMAYVRGFQGDDWTTGILTTAKHFLGYGFSEGGLNWAPAHIAEREIREIFMTPFAAVIKEANVASVMNAYQEIDGIPCGSSRWLLQDLLRKELGFTGTVITDYFTINTFVEYHRIARDKAEAARFALEAGMDVEVPDADCYGQPLLDALHAGDIAIDLVDVCVKRVLTQKIQLGLFENPFVDTGHITEVYSDPARLELSRKLVGKSIVLLKNDGVLPLSDTLKKIAVIGPNADSARVMQGDYHYPSHFQRANMTEEATDAPTPGAPQFTIDWDEHMPPSVTPLAGIRERVSDSTEVIYAQGCSITGDDTSKIPAAVEAARAADVAIVIVGDISGLGKGSTSGEAIDRATLELPGVQQELVLQVAATGTPTVVVLMNGRPPVLTDIVDNVQAIMQTWLPAQEGGHGIADVLFGDVNPAGKLPVTLPRHVGQVPLYYNHKISGGRSHWYGDYADVPTTPLFHFGFGLSYTTFAYSNLRLSSKTAGKGDTVVVQFDITNSGARDGEEVVQLYVNDPISSVTQPVKVLKGFKRLALKAGECKTVAFHLDVAHLAFYDRSMKYVIEPGTIRVMVGSSSGDIHLTDSFEITGETTPVQQVFHTEVEVSE